MHTLDGFSESGFIVDDDSKHLTQLILECYVDKDNPRTEIYVKVSDWYMNNNQNINRQCMEKILSHLTKLICLTEFGDSKELSKYVDMSTSVSAQLIAIEELENNKIMGIKGENYED